MEARRGRRPRRDLAELTAREVDALKSGAKIIPLTWGKWAIVDHADYDSLMGGLWCAYLSGRVWYAMRNIGPAKSRVRQRMHRIIRPDIEGEIDHRDGDGLNNRRENLRPATHVENSLNRCAQRNNSCGGLKGVSFHKSRGKYRASIGYMGKTKHLGYFADAEAAATAYKLAALQIHGAFARSAL